MIFTSLFFAAAMAFGTWVVAAMLASNLPAIGRALRMEIAPVTPTPPAATVTRLRRVIRTRSAVAPAQWRAAA